MKLSRKQAEALGFKADGDAPKKARKPRGGEKPATENRSAAGKLFDEACAAHGLPIPVHEFRFHESRKWRFDYIFEGWLALEIEGGSWTNGAHTRGKHFRSDMEKYNEAVIAGYAVLRCTPEQIEDGSIFATLKRALHGEAEQP